MSETQAISSKERHCRPLCYQAGYLPVPLRTVPTESLEGVKLYIEAQDTYTLYRNLSVEFNRRDHQRLLNAGVEFVYVSVQDHAAYYQTVEHALANIVADENLQQEKKAEIVYSTSMELANQIMLEPPSVREIGRTENLVQSTVQLIIQDDGAFRHLFEVSNHDFYTATHMVNVCSSVVYLAWKMGINHDRFLQNLGTGAILHDIGKLFVPQSLLNARGRLNVEQFEMLHTHVERGCAYLTEVADLTPEVLTVVREHHERLDGSGYPYGLEGNQISIAGRMAGIVDTFEAMTSVRPYREHTFSVEEALTYLKENSPGKYDEDVVSIFTELIQETVRQGEPKAKKKPTAVVEDTHEEGRCRRRHPRYYFRMQMPIHTLSRSGDEIVVGPAEKLIVHNVSRSGLGLLSPRAFKMDQNICASVTLPGEQKPTRLVAVVVHCVNHGDGWYTVGTRFHQMQAQAFINRVRKLVMMREQAPMA